MSLDARLRRQLEALRAKGLERSLPRIEAREGVRYRVDGRAVVGFCGNDYLGLGDDPLLADDDSARSLPSGASASRLICGDLPAHREIEASLAELAGFDDAIVFPSGFQLNLGVLPALLRADDRVDSDALNHASLIDGLRLSQARAGILPHTRPPQPRDGGGDHWWITESIFSMDGDAIEPDDVTQHLGAGGCAYVDEAHALGLFDEGRGLLHGAARPTILVGTLSKAFGCAGAFAAASRTVCAYLRTRARSFVFSTGIAPVILARVHRAVQVVRGEHGDARRTRLWRNAALLASKLDTDPPKSPIFPLLVGANARAVSIANALLEQGWHVQAIRPPTVPTGTARLRVTVTAAHTEAEVEALAAALRAVFERHELPLSVERGRLEPLPGAGG